jgi:GNAT superfamily N-acetyltransferase
MRELRVRPATLDDLDTIVEFRLALLREYRDHPFYAHLRPNVIDRAYELYRLQLSSPNEAMFLAERGRGALGILRCVETHASPVLLPERYGYVSSVYVTPTARRQGVLRALVAAAENWCAQRGITEMRLANSAHSTQARDAWSAMGFEVAEEVRHRPVRVQPTDAGSSSGTSTKAHTRSR